MYKAAREAVAASAWRSWQSAAAWSTGAAPLERQDPGEADVQTSGTPDGALAAEQMAARSYVALMANQ